MQLNTISLCTSVQPVKELKALIEKHLNSGFNEICVFDSGNERTLRILDNNSVKYFVTSANDGIENLRAAISYSNKNILVLHDDDDIYIDNLEKVLLKNPTADIIISPENRLKNANVDLEQILIMYFLSHNQAPLISGIVLRNTSFSKIISCFPLNPYKYNDVELIIKLFKNFNMIIDKDVFIEYNRHDGNDNNIKDLDARDQLYKFLCNSATDIKVAKWIAPLIYYGYPERRKKYFIGVAKLFLRPHLLYLYLIKFALRFKVTTKF